MSKKGMPAVYLLVLAVVCALGAGYIGFRYIHKFTSAKPVVAMAVDKAAFSQIELSDLKVVEVSESAIQPGMFPNVKAVVGQFTKTYIPSGTLLKKAMLAEQGAVPDSQRESGLANPETNKNPLAVALTELKKPDLRAYTIPVDQIQGLGGYIVPGDRIDVTGAMKLPIGLGGSEQPVAKTIVRARTVLSIVKSSEQISGVTLALSPQEAQDIIFALLNGRLSVGLNPYESDQAASDTQTTTSQTFIQKYINGSPLLTQVSSGK